ncbi:MAG: ABC transporter ATP-binding protein [Eubacteriales bacterium]|nr:ABC transporter ATP-binding protein [Eubacteriales bacterium]
MIAIQYKDIVKKYKRNQTLSVNHVTAEIEEGEFITILGSSGCGKTTLLKMTNRLIDPTEGQIVLFGEDISTVDPVVVRRRMGYVIQQVGLFPHMTVEENITVIPKTLKWDRERMNDRVTELLQMVELNPEEYRNRYPSQLSGGQQQRVGLARALVTDPKIMLLDEPFGAIDAITRLNLQNELKRIHAGTKKTFLLVTHDINEAFKLGNRVMIMNEGRLLQFDTPENIVRNPADSFVETLIASAREQEKIWEGIR